MRMSLEEWHRYLESQFVEPDKEKEKKEKGGEGTKPSFPLPSEVQGDLRPSVLDGSAQPGQEKPSLSPPTRTPPPPPTPYPEPQIASPSPPTSPHQEVAVSDSSTVSIRIPSFFAYVPLLRQELGLPDPLLSEPVQEVKPNEVEPPSPDQEDSQPLPRAAVQMIQPAPRFRRRKEPNPVAPEMAIPPNVEELWLRLPEHLRFLAKWGDDRVAQRYYKHPFRESREDLIARLTDPVLSLEDAARLLGVCPATVRRYTNRGWLRHFRTVGGQRRFRLSAIVAFIEAHQAHRQRRRGRKPMALRNQEGEIQVDQP